MRVLRWFDRKQATMPTTMGIRKTAPILAGSLALTRRGLPVVWSHKVVLINFATVTVTVTVKVAHLCLCRSRMLFARAYPRETQG